MNMLAGRLDELLPIQFEDIDIKRFGNDLNITGVIYGNADHGFIAMLPDETCGDISLLKNVDWKALIAQTDQMLTEILVKAKDGTITKAIVRKCERQIDTKVQWAVFRRDKYACQYCFNDHTPLTVDHIVLWEEGGPTIEENLLAACKPCNKTRGNMQFPDWIKEPRLTSNLTSEYIGKLYALYLKADKLPRKINVASR